MPNQDDHSRRSREEPPSEEAAAAGRAAVPPARRSPRRCGQEAEAREAGRESRAASAARSAVPGARDDEAAERVAAPDHILKTPREVRNALRYVLGNGKKHAAEGREVHVHAVIDTFTSAPWFDGFRERVTVRDLDKIERPTAAARSCLLTIGWRVHGLLSVHELPATG